MKVAPHVAQNTSNRKSAVPDHIAASDGYFTSQQKRKLIEQGFEVQAHRPDSQSHGAWLEEGRPSTGQ